jgi:hypothetical protein
MRHTPHLLLPTRRRAPRAKRVGAVATIGRSGTANPRYERRLGWRNPRSISLVGLAALLLATLSAPSQAASEAAITGNENSRIWAGWSTNVRDKAHAPKTEVLGAWRVPQLKCTDGHRRKISRAAMWVGLWGRNEVHGDDPWLPQIGTQSVCAGRHFSDQYVVYQMYRRGGGGTNPEKLGEPTVKPGDLVSAWVQFAGKDSDGRLRFQLSIENAASQQRGHQLRGEATVWTAPDVQESDAAKNGGCILERNRLRADDWARLGDGLAKFDNPLIVSVCRRDLQPLTNSDTRYNMVVEDHRSRHDLARTGVILGSRGEFNIWWVDWGYGLPGGVVDHRPQR